MDTLKQTAVTALLNLPDCSEIDDMIAVLKNIKFNHELANLPTSPPSFLEVAKEYIGSLEGPADLSTNPTYLKDYGQPLSFGPAQVR